MSEFIRKCICLHVKLVTVNNLNKAKRCTVTTGISNTKAAQKEHIKHQRTQNKTKTLSHIVIVSMLWELLSVIFYLGFFNCASFMFT